MGAGAGVGVTTATGVLEDQLLVQTGRAVEDGV